MAILNMYRTDIEGARDRLKKRKLCAVLPCNGTYTRGTSIILKAGMIKYVGTYMYMYMYVYDADMYVYGAGVSTL